MIPDEAVRGRTPPPWFRALSGIERVRSFSRGLLPWPPIARLLGHRTTHVAAGTVTMAMPASDACITPHGQLEFTPLMIAALENASATPLMAGMEAVPMRFTFKAFRPAWPSNGNLLARARVINDSALFVFAEVQVEDSNGRHLALGSLHSSVQRVDPAPPPPPETLNRVDEPIYETPDPYLRSFAVSPFRDMQESEPVIAIFRKIIEGRLNSPINDMFGVKLPTLAKGRLTMTIPASEWFCANGPDVSYQAIGTLADMTAWSCGLTLQGPGESMVALDSDTRFLRPVRADGRLLRADAAVNEPAPGLFILDTRVTDADGQLVALGSGAFSRVAAAQRERRQRKESRRVLATLLFTDIVDSTGHAQRLGDVAWRTLLAQHHLAVRREISRCNGTEVDTAGDGFFARFDSPALAIEAARAIRQVMAGLNLQIRTGIHTGECELDGNRLVGMAVHIAARIQAAAAPDGILVSSTVKDLALGSNHRFADQGEQTLKGVPDPWRLYAVVD